MNILCLTVIIYLGIIYWCTHTYLSISIKASFGHHNCMEWWSRDGNHWGAGAWSVSSSHYPHGAECGSGRRSPGIQWADRQEHWSIAPTSLLSHYNQISSIWYDSVAFCRLTHRLCLSISCSRAYDPNHHFSVHRARFSYYPNQWEDR